jgi:hypothetical protein
MPADVYFGRGRTILIERERIKRQTQPPLAAPVTTVSTTACMGAFDSKANVGYGSTDVFD